MKNFCTAVIVTMLMIPSLVSAQRFQDPAYSFSGKKTSYITKTDGTELQCTIKKLKFEKGLIEEMKIVDLNGDKIKIKPEDIDHMYLPPSGISKVTKFDNFLTDATMWNDELDSDMFNLGYVYFEQSKVKIKKKTETLMVQLLNPDFSSKIKVYDDPLSKETGSVGIAGVKVAGGLAKSYYVKTDDVAVRLKKKEYDDEFPLYFKSCDKIIKQYAKKPDWADFVDHIFTYANECD